MSLRTWQRRALETFQRTDRDILLEACVGAGKTRCASHMARYSLDSGEATFVLVVVPTTPLKSSWQTTMKNTVDIEMTTVLKDGRGRPTRYQAGACTYAQLSTLVSTLETWARNGERTLIIFDEIHHCVSDETCNAWGSAVEGARRAAVRALSLSGTPFRVDGRRISFVQYDNEGKAIADIRYLYEKAVADGVCRHVTFIHDDGVASYALDGKTVEYRISEAPPKEKGRVASAVFRPRTEFMSSLIAKCDRQLDDLRITDPDAACLIICRPSRDRDTEDGHVYQVAKEVRAITGEDPTVVTYKDDDAPARIAAFRKGTSRYIVSVRMISEGIDIPRLRVLMMANYTESEMMFRQMVGRVVRQEGAEPEEGYVYFAKLPPMLDFAARIREEADAGLKERATRTGGSGGGQVGGSVDFQPNGCTHEEGGATSFTLAFTSEEVAEAEAAKEADPALRHVPLHVILHARRVKVEPGQKATEPRQVRVKKLRGDIAHKLRKLASMRGGGAEHKHQAVRLWKAIGVKDMNDLCDNHPDEKLGVAIDLLNKWISEESRGAA